MYVQAIESAAGVVAEKLGKSSFKVSLPVYCERYDILALLPARLLEND